MVACKVAGVTPRMLDYWVNTGVIEPAGVFECTYPDRVASRRKAYHLFDLANIVQVKLVKELRDAGVSLQRVRYAIEQLRTTRRKSWQSEWLVTDGRGLFRIAKDPKVVLSLAKGEQGQHVFSAVALGQIATTVRRRLEARNYQPFAADRMRGQIVTWEKRTIA